MWKPISRLRTALTAALVLVTATGLAACNSSTSSSVNKTTVRFAEFPGSVPNWILPITDPGHSGSPNTLQFSYLMWRPLYWQGTGSAPNIDNSLSIADAPRYSDGNRTVTVKPRDYNWSDGRPVTARDVQFWFNLIKFDKTQWSGYVAGNIPDNVTSFRVVDQKTFQLTLKAAVSPQWYTANQLTAITPMPQHVWDKTSDSGTIVNSDQTATGAKAVFSYLLGRSKQLSKYAADPLWKTVDGPWLLNKYDTDGHITFVPNKRYSGKDKPTIDKFEQTPFATDSAEFNSLLAGDVDYGYLVQRSETAQPRLLAGLPLLRVEPVDGQLHRHQLFR